MGKKVRTVKGDILPGQLGKTMVHEHLFWNQKCWYMGDPEELTLRDLYYQEVKLENRGQIFYHCHQNLDNIVNQNLNLTIEEARYFKMAGGGTLLDLTPIGIGRDPQAMLAVSEANGINIVMGTGFYVAAAHPAALKEMDKVQIADIMIKDITEGVKETGIRAGVIGEIGFSSSDFNPEEIKVLLAAVIAQKETGCSIFIHPPQKRHELLDIVEKEGGDLSRIVICHIDPTVDSEDYLDSLVKRGVYIGYDQFGHEIPLFGGRFLARDIDRIRSIKEQIQRGNLSRILVSQDVCFKINFVKYGGWGYAHILRDILPYMRREGITAEQINTILVDNPAEVLSY